VLGARLLIDEAASGGDPPGRKQRPVPEELFDLSSEAGTD
jgi:hypothetical protein